MTRDRETDRPRGIAYVDFEDAESLRKAIELDGEEFAGRAIRLDVAENKRTHLPRPHTHTPPHTLAAHAAHVSAEGLSLSRP